MPDWLFIGAESREFTGIVKRLPQAQPADLHGFAFARQIKHYQTTWHLFANGPGKLCAEVLSKAARPERLISIGFAGALDPALRIGDIVISGDFPEQGSIQRVRGNIVRGKILTLDRVVSTAAEKRYLHESTRASAVEMEAEFVAEKAREWGVPFCALKAVSDTAAEDLPLDFNLYRDCAGRFSRSKIAWAALQRPSAIRGLIRLERNCRQAAESLGEFLANCQV